MWRKSEQGTNKHQRLAFILVMAYIFREEMKQLGLMLPDDNNDAVEDVVRVPDVSEQAKSQQHEAHLQDKHASENNVTNL